MGGGSLIRRSFNTKSNAELISALQANFREHSGWTNGDSTNGSSSNNPASRTSYKTWTKQTDDVLEIPALDLTSSALLEERAQYDITAKLFYLPGGSIPDRAAQTREALTLVLKALHAPSIDLLIVSFPGIYFDEQEDCPDKIATRGPVEAEPEQLESQVALWRTLATLHDEGLVRRLGLAEFGKERLEAFLAASTTDAPLVRPSVNQINLRDCCSVPKDLLQLARAEKIELLVHNDCSNILPRGTTRELLGSGPDGAGVLAEQRKAGDKRKSLHGEESVGGGADEGLQGDVQPLWVIKYTAVIRDRGVVENKGYFAAAELRE